MKENEQRKKVYNIKEIRNKLGLTQNEFAWLVGISAIYLSQIENGSRILTSEVTIKIANALLKLKRSGDTPYDEIDIVEWASDIKARHLASFHPKSVQDRIVTLMDAKFKIEWELDEILEKGKLPPESFYKGLNRAETPSLYETIPFYENQITENIQVVKDELKKKRRPGY